MDDAPDTIECGEFARKPMRLGSGGIEASHGLLGDALIVALGAADNAFE